VALDRQHGYMVVSIWPPGGKRRTLPRGELRGAGCRGVRAVAGPPFPLRRVQ